VYDKPLNFCLIHDYSVEKFAAIAYDRDLYGNTQHTQLTNIHAPMVFENIISAGERSWVIAVLLVVAGPADRRFKSFQVN
jgi:hypothetical protein